MLLELILLSIFYTAVQSASITCEFRILDPYSCDARITNPDGLDNFPEIYTPHASGKTNANVLGVNGVSTTTVIFPKKICETFVNLKRIDFSGQNLELITNDTFKACARLEFLDLQYNKIKEIHSAAFVNTIALKDLYLGSNNLGNVARESFWRLTSLTTLTLSKNPNIKLDPFLFHNLTSLNTVKIDGCSISDWDEWWFRPLRNLKTVDVSSNSIAEIPQFAFHEDVKLSSLSIQHNLISRLDRNTFGDLSELRYIYAEYNKIAEIEKKIFTDSHLIVANFDKNQCIAQNYENIDSQKILSFEKCFKSYDNRNISFVTSGEVYRWESINGIGIRFNVRASPVVEIIFSNAQTRATVPNAILKIGIQNNQYSQFTLNNTIVKTAKPTSNVLSNDVDRAFIITWETDWVLLYDASRNAQELISEKFPSPITSVGVRTIDSVGHWLIQAIN